MLQFDGVDPVVIENALAKATPDRLLVAAEALRQGFTVERIAQIAGFDPWFLQRLQEIVDAEAQVRRDGLPQDPAEMRRLKAMGFSDARLAQLALRSAHVEREMSEMIAGGSGIMHDALKHMTGGVTEVEVRAHRHKLGVRPVFKRIDSCAAEFDAATPYLYSTYEAPLFGEPEDEGGFRWKADPVFRSGFPGDWDVEYADAEHSLLERPLLVLTGAEDDTWSDHAPEAVAERVAKFQDARHETVPGAGHYVHIEQPDFVIDAIRRFTEEVGR
jgi:pimeloyl-ACP methyl ester carboxylesterase